ncbi:MFS transporter [Frankia sp. AgB32]|uniref:MFS transporter n=1 Tax=Frankia sp. AgB32 TaxID=631119 RepID=UPI00200E8ECE|nr:MFS transporter [Frankia sp. AgB32]
MPEGQVSAVADGQASPVAGPVASPVAVGAGPARRRRVGGGLLADVSPLRDHPAYRRLWLGETVSALGSQITATAVLLQVFAITRSSFQVGLVGVVGLVPLVAGGLFGGAIVDAVDRRRLALITSSALAVVSALFLLLSASGALDTVAWPLFCLVAVQSALLAVDQPARRAMAPNLVPVESLPAASALSQIGSMAAAVCGPLVASLALTLGGFSVAYAVDLATFAAPMYGLARLPAMPPLGGGRVAGVASVVEGLRFLRGQPVLLMTFVVDIIAMVFGMPRALFPELAETRFGGGSVTAGAMYSAVAVGSLLAAGLSRPLGGLRRQGLAVVVSIVLWGGAIAAFGLVHDIALGVLLLAVAGAADMVSAILRNAILNVSTPDEMRGRLQGVFLVVVAGGPRLGDLEAGGIAAAVSPVFSVVSGGLACIGALAVATAAVPALVRYDARAAMTRARARGEPEPAGQN